MSYTIEELTQKTHSYSRLECFKQCPMKYELKYIEEYKTDSNTEPLFIGTLCHEILEEKFKMIKEGNLNTKTLEILFENKIKEINPSEEYVDKLNVFRKRIKAKENLGEWKVFAIELEIKFKIGKYNMVAKIDRVDINKNGDFRVVDYKTNKKLYDKEKLIAPMQFITYALALKSEYGKYPIENYYDMIFLEEIQYCMLDGWKENINCIEKAFKEIEFCIEVDEFRPKPSALCWWCPYGNSKSPNSDGWYSDACEYRSRWKPDDKDNRPIKLWEGFFK